MQGNLREEEKRQFDERTAEEDDESDRHIEARDLKILVLKI